MSHRSAIGTKNCSEAVFEANKAVLFIMIAQQALVENGSSIKISIVIDHLLYC